MDYETRVGVDLTLLRMWATYIIIIENLELINQQSRLCSIFIISISVFSMEGNSFEFARKEPFVHLLASPVAESLRLQVGALTCARPGI